MQCPICKKEMGNDVSDIKKHILFIKTAGDHSHIHGDLLDKQVLSEAMACIQNHTDIKVQTVAKKIEPPIHPLLAKKEIVFHNRQRIGDIIMYTAGIRDFKKAYPDVRVNILSTAGHIWDYNPNIDRSLKATEENTVKIGPGKLTSASNRLDWHFANAFRVSIEDALNIKFDQGKPWGDLYFSREEYNAPRITEKPYWIIVTGGEKGWGCKMFPFERWQKFVNDNPDTLFYQLGAREDKQLILTGDNVVNHVGQTQDRATGIRDLFKLFLNAEGSIGLVSFHMHLSGALQKPAIVVAGAREPVSFTRYPGHRYLSTDGCLPCGIIACWKCDINGCKDLIVDMNKEAELDRKVPRCADIITVEDVSRAMEYYYQGGRLRKGIASAKPTNVNIVDKIDPNTVLTHPTKEQKVKTTIVKRQERKDEVTAFRHQFGYPFNSGSIDNNDWKYISDTIDKNNIKTVLEFGCGLSTLLMAQKGIDVITFETEQKWVDIVHSINPQCDIRLWDGKTADIPPVQFGMVFCDGPSGGAKREWSTKLSSQFSNLVMVHDAHTVDSLRFCKEHLLPIFDEVGRGGHWNGSFLFQKKGTTSPPVSEVLETSPSYQQTTTVPKVEFKNCGGIFTPEDFKPLKIKIVSTARGWGGCARSITTIMKALLKEGHDVEFIPFRNKVSSREFKECIIEELHGLLVTENYDTVSEPCDVFFMYADDYVWEFVKPEMQEVFSKISSKKKIMMLNYRRGRVGEVDWTMHWDKYMFLNSKQMDDFLKVAPWNVSPYGIVETKVLPPCTILDEFLKVNIDYSAPLRMVRHSSQGDTKFCKDKYLFRLGKILTQNPNAQMHLLPGPSFVNAIPDRIIKYPRTADPKVIADFLSKGNLYIYDLPNGYMDMGPRVILEAMACGLPCIVDNWGGAPDRVTDECGWVCNSKEEMVALIKTITPQMLEEKGKAARKRAIENFIPEAYIKELTC